MEEKNEVVITTPDNRYEDKMGAVINKPDVFTKTEPIYDSNKEVSVSDEQTKFNVNK